MYLWKCWRETRVGFVVVLILAAASWYIVHIEALVMDKFDTGGIFVISNPGEIEGYWLALAHQIGVVFLFPCLLVMGFGTSGPGDELARGTADFLLTRPRPRRYFVWASWFAGALEILAVVLVYVFLAFVAAICITRTIYTWKFLLMVLPIFMLGLVFYGPICLMTALERSGRKGYAAGLGLIILYVLLGGLLRARWMMHLPSPVDLMLPFANVVHGASGIPAAGASYSPFVGMVGWSLFALACPALAQVYIERTDV
jgi:ABC-type transport system involved in multi-copper enzyme maturation permease subunit